MGFKPSALARPVAPTRIEPGTAWRFIDWEELARYRELLWFLVWKDLKVRYKQTLLGVAWVVLQPVLAMLIFSLIFGRLAGMPSDGIPYPVFAYVGLLPWGFFSRALTSAPTSLVGNPNLIRKVYFPRYLIPTATILAGGVDFFLAAALLVILMPAQGVALASSVVFLPLFVLLVFGSALGAALWLSALNVRYRDVRTLMPFLIQTWMYASPIVYPLSLIPEAWRPLYALNPLVGVIEGFRWSLLGTAEPPALLLAISAASALAFLVTGILYFRHSERVFADVL